jgi:nucleoside permease NupC
LFNHSAAEAVLPMLPISLLLLAILLIAIGGITIVRILFPNGKSRRSSRPKMTAWKLLTSKNTP